MVYRFFWSSEASSIARMPYLMISGMDAQAEIIIYKSRSFLLHGGEKRDLSYEDFSGD